VTYCVLKLSRRVYTVIITVYHYEGGLLFSAQMTKRTDSRTNLRRNGVSLDFSIHLTNFQKICPSPSHRQTLTISGDIDGGCLQARHAITWQQRKWKGHTLTLTHTHFLHVLIMRVVRCRSFDDTLLLLWIRKERRRRERGRVNTLLIDTLTHKCISKA